MRKKSIIALVSAICIVSSTGCTNTAEEKDRSTKVQQSDVVVEEMVENKEVTKKDIVLKKIDQYRNMRFSDWLSGNEILMTKGNDRLEPIFMDSGEISPQNLYIFDLESSSDKILIEEEFHHGNGMFSPDKKHIFYVQCIESCGTGFIVDAQGNNGVQVSGVEDIFVGEGMWLDNENVIFADLYKNILLANVNGTVNNLLKAEDAQYISNPVKIGNSIYYLDGWNMMVFNLDNEETKLVKENVWEIIPSPDLSQFILVKNSGTERELIFTDLEGNELASFAKGTQICGTSWSPDQSKIAFAVQSNEVDRAGLFVVDISTRNKVFISRDISLISDSIKWSPSGKKLGLSNVNINEEIIEFVTQVIELE